MALYLGDNKISATSKVIVSSGDSTTFTQNQWNDLQNAIEYRTGKAVTANAEIEDLIDQLNEKYDIYRNIKINIEGDILKTWTRPIEWPNLDSLNLEFTGNTSFIYMTYRTGHDDDFFAFHIELVGNAGTATVDFGHINNGSYVIDSTRTVSHNTNNYYYFDEESVGYVVIKITGNIKIFRLIGAAAANGTPDSRTFVAQQQHLLERIAYVPTFTQINYYSYQYWGTYDLEREKIGNGTGTSCTSLYAAYSNCYNLQDLDISNLYTPNVTNLQETFSKCYKLQQINMAHWNVKKVQNFSSMFINCRSLQNLDLSTWETLAATNFSNMFNSCQSLKTITGLENFSTGLVTNMASMFNECRSLNNLNDIAEWNTIKVTAMNSLFSNCQRIKKLDLSNWNVSKVTRVDNMFNSCSSLKEIKFPSVQTANLQYISSLFSGCYCLQSVDLTWLKMNGGTCLQMSNIFYDCRKLTEINFPSNWDLSALNNSNYSHYQIFYNCYSLQKITGIKDWDFRNSTTQSAANMFYNCWSLTDLDISGWKLNSTSYGGFFQNCYSLQSVNISGFDCSNCTSLASMFSGCWSLKEITTPSTWDTSKVTTIASMFDSCYSLTAIPFNITTWNLSKVTTIASMFQSCIGLKSINLNNLNLPLCTTIATLFNYCYNLEEISWSGWSIPKVTSTSPGRLIADCWSLKKMTGFPPVKLAFSMNSTFNLPTEEIITLFNNLQSTGGTARTLNLTTQNINRLSTAEKAIATNKGWTLAN